MEGDKLEWEGLEGEGLESEKQERVLVWQNGLLLSYTVISRQSLSQSNAIDLIFFTLPDSSPF